MVSRYLRLLLAAAALVLPAALHAQLNSTQATVTINATLLETLAVTATPSVVALTLNPGGVSSASTPVVITTAWVLGTGRSSVVLDAFFSSATAALSGGSPVVNIPSSAVYGLVATGSPTSYTAFTQSPALGTAGAGLQLFSQSITASNRTSLRTDNLSLQVNLASQTQLPSGIYSGTLILQAQAL